MTGLTAYALRVRWELATLARSMIVLGPLQVAFAGSLAIGLGLLLPDLTPAAAQYLTTGAPTVVLLTTGIAVVPQEIARRRDTGVHDFLKTLPGPRTGHLAAVLTPHLIVSLPSALLSVVIAAWHFDFALDPSPALVPALMFVAATGAAIGVALANLSPNTTVTSVLAQLSIFFIMLFSPINYPADRLPDWLAAVHEVLPFESMADVIRSALVGESIRAADMAQIAAWAVGSFALSARLATRRQ